MGSMNLIPDIMEEEFEKVLIIALENFLIQDKETAWPAAFSKSHPISNTIKFEEIDIIVLPLERIGAPQGQSGASVFIIYFSDKRKNPSEGTILASPPHVIKIGNHKKLSRETNIHDRWDFLHQDIKNRFAIPYKIFQYNKDLSVLIAPFTSVFAPDSIGLRHRVDVLDLWKLLNNMNEIERKNGWAKEWNDITIHLFNIVSTINHLHRAGKGQYQREKAYYKDKYDWYLRNTVAINGKDDKNYYIPKLLFGENKDFYAFGQEWPNPIILVKYLLSKEFTGVLNHTHGDLHPKNIVLNEQKSIRIIDFGWANEKGHVVVDYILLEINIRATTLPSQLPESDIVSFANFLDYEQDVNELPISVRHRANAIKEIFWKNLKENKIVLEWELEYLIPIFLVSFGLLVHLDKFRSQQGLIALILATGKQIKNYIGKKEI